MSSQFNLITQRRFGPFFATQLAGAFNDSFFKQVVILLVTFHGSQYTNLSSGLVTNIAAGLFILPFVLLSALAGQMADRYDKSLVIRSIKAVEIGIMLVASAGFFMKSLPILLFSVFAMGCHSAFFGPVKYSMLSRVLEKNELTAGNGLLEMGTFLSILGGTLVAGVLVATTSDPLIVSLSVTLVAIIGLATSAYIPLTGQADPHLKVSVNIFKETISCIKMAKSEGVGVWNSLLAISWFWFVGSLILSQIPSLGKDVIKGDASVVTLLLAIFSIGVAIGSILCERLSGHKVEVGLVPVGSIGLSLFTLDLALSASSFNAFPGLAVTAGAALPWDQFIETTGSIRILADIGLIGLFGGLFIVPLYAFVQLRTNPQRQSRIIGANNILNALFMVGGAAMSIALLSAGVSVPGLILVCAGLNALVALYIYRVVPEFLWRFVCWTLIHGSYKLEIKGIENIPESGAAILAPNHVSYLDAFVLSALSPRPIRFVMDAGIFKMPIVSWLFRQVRAIPITSARSDAIVYEKAFADINQALRDGELVCIFPEGALTKDGSVAEFKNGIRKALDAFPVPVIPIGLNGLWASKFSRNSMKFFDRVTRLKPGRPLHANVGQALPAETSVATLKAKVEELLVMYGWNIGKPAKTSPPPKTQA